MSAGPVHMNELRRCQRGVCHIAFEALACKGILARKSMTEQSFSTKFGDGLIPFGIEWPLSADAIIVALMISHRPHVGSFSSITAEGFQ
jgi:hypothetical protein